MYRRRPSRQQSGGHEPRDWAKIDHVVQRLTAVLETHAALSERMLRAAEAGDADSLDSLIDEAGRELQQLPPLQMELETHWPGEPEERERHLEQAPGDVRDRCHRLTELTRRAEDLDGRVAAALEAQIGTLEGQQRAVRHEKRTGSKFHRGIDDRGGGLIDRTR
ncbi:MAG: hypothetical protein GF320_04200 [Armatimonadia bacterium]|nr:hypothetical protein [Armatimonadia bacterium]